jgi:putative oxidoreductase
MFPALFRFTDLGLLLLRLMVGLVFVTSGWSHLKDPEARSKSIEMSKGFTIFLGIAEVTGGLGVAFGVLTQLAAIGLILIMLGAIQKKIFVWHTGFWGEKAGGWHYDLMFILMNLMILFTDGGSYTLMKLIKS